MQLPVRLPAQVQQDNYKLLFLFVCLCLLHWGTLSFSFKYWWGSSTYGHGLLVFPLSVLLVWIKRSSLLSGRHRASGIGLSIFVLCSAGWWAGYAADVAIVMQLGFFGMVGSLFWALYGWRTTSTYLIPLVLPLFTLPLWSPVVPLLQYMTTHVTAFALSLINVPIYVESHFIHIPEGQFSIEEVCAGLRYLLAALVVALVYVYLYVEGRKNQWLFIGFVVLLSLAVNWIRVFAVILAGHLTDMNHSLVRDHADFGWWLFAFTLIPIFWVGRWLVKKEQMGKSQGNDNDEISAVVDDNNNTTTVDSGAARYPFIVLLTLVLVVPLSGFYLKARHMTDLPLTALHAPGPAGHWGGPFELARSDNRPAFQGADREMFAGYKQQESEVMLYVAQYLYQQQGKELIAEYNHLYDPAHWQPHSQTRQQVALSGGRAIEVREVVLSNKAGQRRLLWYWYSVAGTNITDPVKAKVLQIKSLLVSEKPGSNVVLMMTGANRGIDSARDTLSDYLATMYDDINRAIYANS